MVYFGCIVNRACFVMVVEWTFYVVQVSKTAYNLSCFRLLQFVKRVNLRKKFEANRKNENEKKRNGENDNKLSKSGQRSLAGAKERAFNLKRAPAPSQTSPEIFSKQTLITVDKRAFLLTFFHVLLSSSCTSNFGESGSRLEVHPENLSYLSGVFIENP